MVGRGVHDEFQRAPQHSDPFGVDEELIQQADRLLQQDHPGREAQECERRPVGQGRERRPGLPQRGREVVAPARMVHDVTGPEQPNGVMRAVVPVVGDFVREEQPDPGQWIVCRKMYRRKQIQSGVGGHHHQFPADVDDGAADAHGQTGSGVTGFVSEFVVVGEISERQGFQYDAEHENGNGVQDEVEHDRSILRGRLVRSGDEMGEQALGLPIGAFAVSRGDQVGERDAAGAIGVLVADPFRDAR
ncbi:hypothetical protein ABH933_008265 [Nocardia sp. GP40]